MMHQLYHIKDDIDVMMLSQSWDGCMCANSYRYSRQLMI